MYILFDIGGTHIRVARTVDSHSFSEPVKTRTPQAFADGVAEFQRMVKEIAQGEAIEGIVGGIAGVLDLNTKRLIYSPHLPQWVAKPLEELAPANTGTFFVENDAAMAGLGEVVFGSGRGDKIVAYFTISTGVGGARIVKGRISDRALGFEPGHQIIDYKTGETLESIVSGSAIEKKYGKKPHELDGDENLWKEMGEIAGIGIHNSILHWSPDIVVVGGSIGRNTPQIFIDTLTDSVGRHLKAFPKMPLIAKAALGDQSGLYGALAYVEKTLRTQKN